MDDATPLDPETEKMLREALKKPAQVTEDERAALMRLLAIAQSDTGTSARVREFLLAWWNASTCGGFDLTNLWAMDRQIKDDIKAVVALLCRHSEYPHRIFDAADPRGAVVAETLENMAERKIKWLAEQAKGKFD
jgi:hypothetical protein